MDLQSGRTFLRVEELLSDYFPPSKNVHALENGRTYTDSDIQEIASLLRYLNRSWSRVPRAYIVLRVIGQLSLLDDFIKSRFTDHWFPVTARSLPPHIDTRICRDFVRAQPLVLTKSVDLEKGENGRHRHFGRGEPLPLESKEILGAGSYGQVDRVVSLISYKEYARKQIHRQTIFKDKSKEAMERFVEELHVLKKLQHRHTVQLIGSYTDPSFLGLLLSPIADMDLSIYLADNPIPPSLSKNATIRTWFGCLVTGLQYLHEKSIRHKDIKPQNILVKGERVLFTDFGLSRDSTDCTGSTTSGPAMMTPRYCAPEVAAQSPRNSSSDIWSLGCVFLEMTSILKGWNIDQYKAYFKSHGTEEPYVYNNVRATEALLSELRKIGSSRDNKPLDWSLAMLQIDRSARPTAATLATSIICNDEDVFGFCGICCRGDPEPDGPDELAEIFENMGIGEIQNDITETAVERAPNLLSCEKRPYRPTGARLALPPVPERNNYGRRDVERNPARNPPVSQRILDPPPVGFFWPSEPPLAHDPIASHGEMDSQLITVRESIPKPQEARHKNIEQPDFANRRLVIRKPREESLSPASHKRTQSRPSGNKNERVKTSKTPARKTQELKLPPTTKSILSRVFF